MNDYGDDLDRRGGDRPRRGGRRHEEALRRVKAPAWIMIIFAAIVICYYSVLGIVSVVAPEIPVDARRDAMKGMAGGGVQQAPRAEEMRQQQITGPIGSIFMVSAATFMLIGGIKMKSLRGWGWALAGSILAIFPGMCCCCTGLLPGIWALVVLLNADVKQAFSNASRYGS
jgi:hypothetical protein